MQTRTRTPPIFTQDNDGTICIDGVRAVPSSGGPGGTPRWLLDLIVRRYNTQPELLEVLRSALRYIEVSVAYKGCMTVDQVEAAILRNANYSKVEIGCNSVNTLASFDIAKARGVIAETELEI